MLLEDQALIAVDVEEMLREAGAGHTEVISSCKTAEEWLVDTTPALAIVELKVHDGSCKRIIDILEERRIPYIVHTAEVAGSVQDRPSTSRVRWLEKPSHPEDLKRAIHDSLRR